MQFLDLVDERIAPLINAFIHYWTGKLLNIAASPRVSVSFSSLTLPPRRVAP